MVQTIVFLVCVSFAFTFSAFAHCGSCGVGKKAKVCSTCSTGNHSDGKKCKKCDHDTEAHLGDESSENMSLSEGTPVESTQKSVSEPKKK